MNFQKIFFLTSIILVSATAGMSQDTLKKSAENIIFTQTKKPEYRFIFPEPSQDTMLLRLKKQYPDSNLKNNVFKPKAVQKEQ